MGVLLATFDALDAAADLSSTLYDQLPDDADLLRSRLKAAGEEAPAH